MASFVAGPSDLQAPACSKHSWWPPSSAAWRRGVRRACELSRARSRNLTEEETTAAIRDRGGRSRIPRPSLPLCPGHELTPFTRCSQAESAAKRMAALIEASPSAKGVRIGMANDWGSPTGFTYTMGFVTEAELQVSCLPHSAHS
jgi:hypothetical protein